MDEIVRIGCRFVSQERKGQVSQHIDQMEKKKKGKEGVNEHRKNGKQNEREGKN